MTGGVRKKGSKWYYYFDTAKVDGKRQKIERAVAVLERKIRTHEGRVKPSPKTKAMFYLFRSFAKRPGWNQADADYWKQKGWTDKVRPWNHKS